MDAKPPPQGVTIARDFTPLARELAEYQLLMKDLEAAHAALKLWFEKYASRKDLTPEQILIGQSLFRDSIVMFVGCFDKTAPLRLVASDIYKTTNQMEYFQWLLNIRDAYAAHKFGALRQCAVGVFVDTAGNIIGPGHTNRIWAGPKVAAKDDVLSFIQLAGLHVATKILGLSRQLHESAKKMAPAELAALKAAETHDVEPHEIRTPRHRFRR